MAWKDLDRQQQTLVSTYLKWKRCELEKDEKAEYFKRRLGALMNAYYCDLDQVRRFAEIAETD